MSILNLLFVPKCVHCGSRLNRNTKVSLCEKCENMWTEEKNSPCPKCGQESQNCWCGVELDSKHNIYCENHLSYYRYKNENVTRSLIFAIKTKENRLNIDMIASEFEAILKSRLSIDLPIITYVPRSPKSIREHGFDQSKLLANALSKMTDIPVVKALTHTGNTVQKTLGKTARKENAAKSFKLNNTARKSIKNKDVILVDDLVTTGATIVRCADQLKWGGAKRIYVICIAKSY